MTEGQKYHCGPKNAPKWVRRILSIFFNASCYNHDLNFSPESNLTIKEANEIFLIDMTRQSGNNIFKLILAVIFFWAVQKQGHKHFKGLK